MEKSSSSNIPRPNCSSSGADPVENLPPRGDAVHRRHRDVEELSLVAPRAAWPPRRADRRSRRSRARPGPRCRRNWSSGRAGRSRGRARGERRAVRPAPAGRPCRCSAGRRSLPGPNGFPSCWRRQTPVGTVVDRAHARIAGGDGRRGSRGSVRGGVVDDDHLEAGPGLPLEERLEAVSRQLEPAVGHDHHRDERPATRGPRRRSPESARDQSFSSRDLAALLAARVVGGLGERLVEKPVRNSSWPRAR